MHKQVLLLGLLIASCNKDQPVAQAPASSSVPSAPNASPNVAPAKPAVGSAIDDAAESDDPIDAMVTRAFEGNKPKLPMLSKDGGRAAVEMREHSIGMQSYSVGFVPPRGKPRIIDVVDAKETEAIAQQRLGDGPATKVDVAKHRQAAKAVTEQLADFSAFEGSVDEIAVPDLAEAGPFKLQTTQTEQGVLTLTVHEDGKQIASEKFKPVVLGEGGGERVVARPTPMRAWFDRSRRRLLVHIGWADVPDPSISPADVYHLFVAK